MKNPIRALLVLSLLGPWPLLAADPQTRPLASGESVTVAASGDRVHLDIMIAQAPAREAEVRLVQGEKYVAWSAPLTLNAVGSGRVALDPQAACLLVLAERVAVVFRDGEGNDQLTVNASRATLAKQYDAIADAVRNIPPFFNPPEGPAAPAVPDASASREDMEHFVNAIRQWDATMASHVYRYSAARSQARALWIDLRTAERITWPESVIASQREAYADLQTRHEAMLAERTTVRQKAREVVQSWRNAHPDQSGDLSLTFIEIS